MWYDFLFTDLILAIAGVILFALAVICVETERLIGGLGVIILAIIGYDYTQGGAVQDWISTHPFHLIGYALVYLAFGALYTAFWEWNNYCREHPIDPARLQDFLEKNPNKNAEDFYISPYHFDLHPINHFQRLTNWMMLWPFALFWTLLHDPITWVGRTLYDLMGNIFLKIAVSAAKKGS